MLRSNSKQYGTERHGNSDTYALSNFFANIKTRWMPFRFSHLMMMMMMMVMICVLTPLLHANVGLYGGLVAHTCSTSSVDACSPLFRHSKSLFSSLMCAWPTVT